MGSSYRGRRSRRGVKRGLAGLSAAVVCTGLAVGVALISPLPRSLAVTGNQALSSVAQVCIFENGRPLGGGTIVDSNWVLTVAHLFDRPDNPGAYSLRFGVTDISGDSSDSNLRQIDRIVLAPQGDMAMVHFATAVPSRTWMPQIANQLPNQWSQTRLYGWGTGNTLNAGIGIVYDADAGANADDARPISNSFAYAFPRGINPIVTTLPTGLGDSGSGVFSGSGLLIGVHAMDGPYRDVNSTGTLTGPRYGASFEEPVHAFRQWIMDTINGAGSSSSGTAPNDELRKLLEEPDTTDPDLISDPPSSGVCDDDQPSCTEPTEIVGNLETPSDGDTMVTCASGGPACSYGGNGYSAGQTASIPLSGQQVEAWCRTAGQVSPSASASASASALQFAEVSFTNSDPAVATGYGWWHVDPGAVSTGSSGTLDASTLISC